MAKITTGSTFGVTTAQLQAVQMRADGFSIDRIAMALFDVRDSTGGGADPNKLRKAKEKIRKWWKDPKVIEMYKAILTEYLGDLTGAAVKKLGEQLDNKNGWLANKAANDILSRTNVFADEDKKVVVKVEGMPVIGVPDEE